MHLYDSILCYIALTLSSKKKQKNNLIKKYPSTKHHKEQTFFFILFFLPLCYKLTVCVLTVYLPNKLLGNIRYLVKFRGRNRIIAYITAGLL